jgi:iron-sulfur cluster repair protein YtfE (RIC family)
MEDTILNLMLNHHALIGAIYSLFVDEVKEKSQRAEATLSELSWEVKKHFFVEETVIFDFLPVRSMNVFEMINRLKDEHVAVLLDLKKFSDNLQEVKEEEIENLSKLLEGHAKTEEKDLYPKLDKELPEEQKRQIILRINQVPINKKAE